MPLGLGVIILLLLVAIGGGVAAATKRPERPQAPPQPPPETPPPFQPAPVAAERLPPTPSVSVITPAPSPKGGAKAAKMKQLAKLVAALGPEPGIGKITETLMLAESIDANETVNALKDRLKVAVDRVQQQERLKAGAAAETAGIADFSAFAK